MASWPPLLRTDACAAMLNFEIGDHPVYDGLDLQWFDDAAHGTGMLALLVRTGGHPPVLRIGDADLKVGKLPGERLHRRRLIKYATSCRSRCCPTRGQTPKARSVATMRGKPDAVKAADHQLERRRIVEDGAGEQRATEAQDVADRAAQVAERPHRQRAIDHRLDH